MALAHKLATYDDLLALPEDTRAELLAGEIVVQPSASAKHQRIQSRLSHRIGGPFEMDDEPGGWVFIPDVDVRFTPRDVVRPDHAGWRSSRLPDPDIERPIDVVPDWVCEILSSSNSRYDRGYKADLYASHGVGHYWLIDPASRFLEVFALSSGRWTRLGYYDEHSTARIPPFDAIELPLSALFPPILPQT